MVRLASALPDRPVLLASELAVQREEPPLGLVRHPGRQAYDRWSRPVVPAREMLLAARSVAAAEPGSSLRPRSDQWPLPLPDRQELQAGSQAPGAAAAPVV